MRKDFKFLPYIVLNGAVLYDYQSLMMLLRLSLHVHQLQRRKTKYPQHFTEINGRIYVSRQYAQLLAAFQSLNQKQKEAAL